MSQSKSLCRRLSAASVRVLGATSVVVAALGLLPATASAHGPVAPLASSYLARVSSVPTGLEAKVIDGDQRMWLRVPAAQTVVVLDYRGAPYLRFDAAGVQVNQNSEMYYLNQTPVAETPPSGLSAATPPRWQRASGGHEYNWHDGRLHALAAVALPPGVNYAGGWRVPVRLAGRPAVISGGLWHASAPSLVWFWPVLVLLLCVLAARRLRNSTLDQRLARGLALAVLVAIAVASGGRELHGRPTVSSFALIELAAILAVVAWAAVRVLSHRAGFLTLFVIAFAGVWEGVTLATTLVHGFVLMAVPAFLARTAAVLSLGGGLGLLLLAFRLAEVSRTGSRRDRAEASQPPSPPSEGAADALYGVPR